MQRSVAEYVVALSASIIGSRLNHSIFLGGARVCLASLGSLLLTIL